MTSVLSPNTTAGSPPVASSAAAAALLTSHPFTCNTCQVAFRSSEQQRSHMHTDWHRYNLKRRITSLPPLASEVFAEKVLHIQATNRIERERATFSKECKTCVKTYFSENAYNNHLGSSKHRQNVAAEKLGIKPRTESVVEDKDETGSVISSTFSMGTAEGEESQSRQAVGVMEKVKEEKEEETKERKEAEREFAEMVKGMNISDDKDGVFSRAKGQGKEVENEEVNGAEEVEPTPLPLEECLFCNYTSPTLALNVSHMSKVHGLFIPEQNYLVDLPGLIRYLGEKVAILHECLYCGKMKGGLEGVRTHMRDVGHCKIAFETEEEQVEVGEFYDFRSTYEGVDASDDQEEDEDVKPHRRRSIGGIRNNKKSEAEFKPENGDKEGADDAGWETDSSASSLDSTELCAVPLDHHTHSGGSSQDGKDNHHHHHAHPHRHHVHGPAHHHVHHSAVYHTEYELHLPSGRTAGHRSLARYYRQNLSHPLSERLARQPARRLLQDLVPENNADDENDENDEDVDDIDVEEVDSFESEQTRELSRRERRDLFFGRMNEEDMATVLGAEGTRRHERGLGGTARGELGMVGVSAEKRMFVREEERRARKDERRERERVAWKVQKAANSQKHYRDPLLQ